MGFISVLLLCRTYISKLNIIYIVCCFIISSRCQLQSSKLDSQLLFEIFNANLLNNIGQILHGSGSAIQILRIAVQVSNIDILHLLQLCLKRDGDYKKLSIIVNISTHSNVCSKLISLLNRFSILFSP